MKESILIIHIKRKYYDMILSREKIYEYRVYKKYWIDRLVGKKYDYILFINGYKKDSPKIKACYLGYDIIPKKLLPYYAFKEFYKFSDSIYKFHACIFFRIKFKFLWGYYK